MIAIGGRTSNHVQQLMGYARRTGQSIDLNYVNQRVRKSLDSSLVCLETRHGCTLTKEARFSFYHYQTGLSAFEYALRHARYADSAEEVLSIIRLLLHYPTFDVNRPLNSRGETALMLAMSREYGNANVVKELLKLPGIDLNKRSYVSEPSTFLAFSSPGLARYNSLHEDAFPMTLYYIGWKNNRTIRLEFQQRGDQESIPTVGYINPFQCQILWIKQPQPPNSQRNQTTQPKEMKSHLPSKKTQIQTQIDTY